MFIYLSHPRHITHPSIIPHPTPPQHVTHFSVIPHPTPPFSWVFPQCELQVVPRYACAIRVQKWGAWEQGHVVFLCTHSVYPDVCACDDVTVHGALRVCMVSLEFCVCVFFYNSNNTNRWHLHVHITAD